MAVSLTYSSWFGEQEVRVSPPLTLLLSLSIFKVVNLEWHCCWWEKKIRGRSTTKHDDDETVADSSSCKPLIEE